MALRRTPESWKRKICPRLASGAHREPLGNALPPDIKQGLRYVAYKNGWSTNRVVEAIVMDWFAKHFGTVGNTEYLGDASQRQPLVAENPFR